MRWKKAIVGDIEFTTVLWWLIIAIFLILQRVWLSPPPLDVRSIPKPRHHPILITQSLPIPTSDLANNLSWCLSQVNAGRVTVTTESSKNGAITSSVMTIFSWMLTNTCCLVVVFRLRNDLYCVGWGVKLYSLTYCLVVSLSFGLSLPLLSGRLVVMHTYLYFSLFCVVIVSLPTRIATECKLYYWCVKASVIFSQFLWYYRSLLQNRLLWLAS